MEGPLEGRQGGRPLHIGLSYYETQDYQRAAPELQKVLTMTGAGERQIHEATLRLRLRKLTAGDEKVLTVLFIGASHTQVWDIPQIVEVWRPPLPREHRASLPADSSAAEPESTSSGKRAQVPIRHGGKSPENPWDFVAFETHPVLFGHDNFVKYATRFAGLIRGKNSKPILFEARRSSDHLSRPISSRIMKRTCAREGGCVARWRRPAMPG